MFRCPEPRSQFPLVRVLVVFAALFALLLVMVLMLALVVSLGEREATPGFQDSFGDDHGRLDRVGPHQTGG